MDFSTILENFNLATFGQIMFANVVLSGDNAVLIGLAAAGLPAAQRSRAILFGMLFATVLRIIFSIFAVYLLEVPGLLLMGGLLLLWIAYGFFKELRDEKHEEENPEGHEDGAGGKSMIAIRVYKPEATHKNYAPPRPAPATRIVTGQLWGVKPRRSAMCGR